MVKRVTLLVLILAAAAGLLSAGLFLLSTRADQAEIRAPAAAGGGKPAVDAVANFTPFDPPRPAPPEPFTNGEGAPLSLADFRGRVVLLNFWATWCAPCVEEMPSLDRLQAKLGGRGLSVVALSQDRQGAEVVEPFYDRLGLSHLEVYLDPRNRIGRAFEVRGLPTTILIDRQGRAVAMTMGPAEWDSPDAIAFVERYLRTPPEEGAGTIRTGG
jgi:thiol-disulfide isomerase/thioredoxin